MPQSNYINTETNREVGREGAVIYSKISKFTLTNRIIDIHALFIRIILQEAPDFDLENNGSIVINNRNTTG